MNEKQKTIFWLGLGLALLTLSCQTLGDFQLGESAAPTPTPVALPHSAYEPPTKKTQVFVGQPIPIETHHLTFMHDRLDSLGIRVNGQPIRTEAAAGPETFPPELATIQVVTRSQPAPVSPVSFEPPSFPTCQDALTEQGPVMNSPLSPFPASVWDVCYIWIGHYPGTYDLSVMVTDTAGRPGEWIFQRIEVIDPTR
jgi:hypothetical protein